jgi:tripartite-type tricarboxylate transporter receptor subunit TctC
MKLHRHTFRRFLVAAGLLCATMLAAAQPYPAKPLRWVVGFPAGGGSDVLARNVGAQLTQQFKQQVIIDNRPGAAGMLAAENIAHSPADGYNVLTGDIAILAFNPALYPKIRYDATEDFVPVGLMARFPLIIATHPASGIQSMQQLVSDAKAGKNISYGSAGVGTPHHMAMELLNSTTGIATQHIPYRGDAPAVQDLLGGQLPVAVLAPSLSLPYFRNGKLRALAVTSDKRMAQLPDVPTLKELGFASTAVYAWQGMVAPKGTPAPIVASLSAQLQLAVAAPDVQRKLADLGMEPMATNGSDMAAYVRGERAIWDALIKARGIKGE